MMAINTIIGEYSVIQRLGQNRAGGRYTWLAEKDGQQFVVKQFSFSKDANWDGFKALEREVEILKSLDHLQIPKYVDFFDTSDGWCLVQEYIDAESLAGKQRSLDQVKDIAIQVLRILVYLQNLDSPLIHRDIKPENLLQTKDGTVYLVDFGFSRAGFDDLSASSVMLGTVGFMPPEYMFGGPPTKAADLYSLGATLICLLTGTPTHRMGELIEDFALSPKAFERCQDEGFKNWLIKLTKMRVAERFQDAEKALNVLAPSVLLTTPELCKSDFNVETSAILKDLRDEHLSMQLRQRIVKGFFALTAIGFLGWGVCTAVPPVLNTIGESISSLAPVMPTNASPESMAKFNAQRIFFILKMPFYILVPLTLVYACVRAVNDDGGMEQVAVLGLMALVMIGMIQLSEPLFVEAITAIVSAQVE